ncbi:hypothetical protein CH260_03235 [Rhodococcus sp. 05-2256-B2]|nr:hypothetical protein CH258_22765 [Rhodococcus sp. 05-2256-B4]OZD93927.1 hypothetical protein CH257_10645 [Rhodococcus sp. 05-2256-B3]OZE01026.1 hypothetical protein CH260_03235 [Rhodococcus sp. 05-2256-B2]OZE04629.1 hypothetical protein CH285_09395 [Rhodococcus sp. 05-2256-B1]
MAVESDALRIAYTDGDRRVVESVDLELTDPDRAMHDLSDRIGARGPFDSVVITGREARTLRYTDFPTSAGLAASVETVDEHYALLAFVRSLDTLADATTVLVLDLGRRGTSALVVNTAEETVAWHDRTESFGGERLDDVVQGLVMTKGILPEPEGPEGAASYRTFFRELRELLTTSAGVRAPNNGPMILERDEFEAVATPLIDDMIEWVGPRTPDAIVLLGGVANSPLVQRRVRATWPVPLTVHDSVSPVAEGALIRAEIGSKQVPDPVVEPSPVVEVVESESSSEVESTTQPEAEPELAREDPSPHKARGVGRRWVAAIPLSYLSTFSDRQWTRQAVLKIGAVAVSVGVVVVALMFALFADFDNAPRSVINTDPGFEATLAEIAPPVTDTPPPDQPAAAGPTTLTYEQLYVEQYSYTGEMYQPPGEASDIGFGFTDTEAEQAGP